MFLNNLTDKEMYIKNSSQDLIKQHEQIENNCKIRDNFDNLPKDLFKYFSTNSDKEKMSLRFKYYQPWVHKSEMVIQLKVPDYLIFILIYFL